MNRTISRSLVVLAAILFCGFLFIGVSLLSQVSLTVSLAHFDSAVSQALIPFEQSKPLAEVMFWITCLANPLIIIVFETSLLAVILIIKRRRIAELFLSGIIFGELASLIFKDAVGRARPTNSLFHLTALGNSFPSGHALLGTIFYGSLGFFAIHLSTKRWQRVTIGVITFSIILLIGISRVFLGVHYASDVLAGWSLGGSFLCIIGALFYKLHHHKKAEYLAKLITAKEKKCLTLVACVLLFFLISYIAILSEQIRSIL